MNRALRRLVHDEEEAARERRERLQKILKQRLADAAAAAAAAGASSIATEGGGGGITMTQPPSSAAVTAMTSTAANEADDDDDDEEVIEQQKLLASTTAVWRCLEDSQQAVCVAMNRRQTLFAVGEKEGRLSIWDNTTIRVITKELDPTAIILPTEEASPPGAPALDANTTPGNPQANDESLPPAKRLKTQTSELNVMTPDGDGDGEGSAGTGEDSADCDSATNEDDVNDDENGSATQDDDQSVETATDEPMDKANDENDGADGGGDGNDDDEEDRKSVEDDDDDDDDTVSVDMDNPDPLLAGGGADSAASAEEEEGGETSVAGDASTHKHPEGGGSKLTLEELKLVKTSLKHVLSCAWSCDSRWLFAGCEEKSNRRGRLCVWDADAAWLLATFSFDAPVNCLAPHPTDPDLVIVCWYNHLPMLLNHRTREMTELTIPITNPTLTATLPPNSRHPSLIVSARYGLSGRYLYCATSKSTISILETVTMAVVSTKLLSTLVQFIDVAVTREETSLVITSSKGLHEFAILRQRDGAETAPYLEETRMYATGAVRAPWALCCFSSDEGYVVGMPIVRHRHVGESGLYTWNRTTGRVQHNLGVKDGINSVAWDLRRDAIVTASCVGAIHVLEEPFTTSWPGTMYPAGFRLITDNEIDMEPLERELALEEEQRTRTITTPSDASDPSADPTGPSMVNDDARADAKSPTAPSLRVVVDAFTMPDERDPFERLLPAVARELWCIPSIPIPQPLKRHHHHDFHIERHFGLGQSVFEPLKSAIKKPSGGSKKKKKKASPFTEDAATGEDDAGKSNNSGGKSKSKSTGGGGSSSNKKRRR